MIVVLCADDIIGGFQHRTGAERYLRDMKERFAEHPEKTCLIEFGRCAAANRARRGEGKPDTFDLLGSRISAGPYGTAGDSS